MLESIITEKKLKVKCYVKRKKNEKSLCDKRSFFVVKY